MGWVLTISWCRHTGEEVAASSEEGANCVHGGNIGDIEMFWLIGVVDVMLGVECGAWLKSGGEIRRPLSSACVFYGQ